MKIVNNFQPFLKKNSLDVCVVSKHASEKYRNFRDEAKVQRVTFPVYF